MTLRYYLIGAAVAALVILALPWSVLAAPFWLAAREIIQRQTEKKGDET